MGVVFKHLTTGREFDRTRASDNQLGIGLNLELFDGLRDCRLGYTELLRRLRQGLRRSDRGKNLQCANLYVFIIFHAASISELFIFAAILALAIVGQGLETHGGASVLCHRIQQTVPKVLYRTTIAKDGVVG